MPLVDDVDLPQFGSADALRAAGIDSSTLKNWISRGDGTLIGLDRKIGERKANGPGNSHKMSFRRIMQIALTARLVVLGIKPNIAAYWALCFTDIGDERRSPCHHFPKGQTWLVSNWREADARVVNILDTTPATEIFSAPYRSIPCDIAAVVNITEVETQVRSLLDLPLEPKRGANGGSNAR